ncbi:MAG: hypothetical protein WDO12_03735 [Pseudomonadota bacterium]
MALLLLVLAATSAQQLVVQTHWHVVPVRRAVATASPTDAGSTTDDGCLLCQIAAHAGAAAPPAVLHEFTTGSDAVAYVAAFCSTDVPAVPAHAWQSRGPPAA